MATKPVKITVIISFAIQILSSTTISVKNKMIIFAHEAIIFAVFCFVRFNV
jgi:hypothetical protein